MICDSLDINDVKSKCINFYCYLKDVFYGVEGTTRWNPILGYLSEEQLVEDIVFLILPDVTLKPTTPGSELVLCPPEKYKVSFIAVTMRIANRSLSRTLFQ